MNESSLLIKDIIKYLKDVYDGEKIERLSQSFFISNKELDKILSEYFVFFKNENGDLQKRIDSEGGRNIELTNNIKELEAKIRAKED